MHYYAILGNARDLAFAELEVVLRRSASTVKVTRLTDQIVHLQTETELNPAWFYELGGTVRLTRLVAVTELTSKQATTERVAEEIVTHLQTLPADQKPTLGFSTYGAPPLTSRELLQIAKLVKRRLKDQDQTRPSLRFILPDATTELSAATLVKHQLVPPETSGQEIVLLRTRSKLFLTQTVAIQDIEAWAARDVGKPARQARLGMLPPKLARMLVNLALAAEAVKTGMLLFDPFCGTGTVIMEASLLGLSTVGSDLDPSQVERAERNIAWFKKQYPQAQTITIMQADARQLDRLDNPSKRSISHLVTEPLLGPPLDHDLYPEDEKRLIAELSPLYHAFLASVRPLLTHRARLVIIFPRWKRAALLPSLLDDLATMGYSLKQQHAYERQGQFVRRDIAVLEWQPVTHKSA